MKQTSEQFIEYRHLWWFLLITFSLMAGAASIYVSPIFIMAGVIAIINVVLIFKYPMWGLLLYVAIFLLRPGEMFPAIAPLRIEFTTGIIALTSSLLHQKYFKGKVFVPKDRITLLLLAFLGAMFFSLFVSYEMTQTIEICKRFIKTLIFIYLIVSVVDDKKKFIQFVTFLVMVISYIAFDSLRAYLTGGFVHTMNVDRLTGSISSAGDPNALGATLVLTTPLIIALAIYYKNTLLKIGLGFLSVFMVVLMTITASRSGLLAFLGVVMVAIAYSKHKLMYAVIAVFLAIAGWFMLPDQYQDRYLRFGEVGDNINDVSSGRVEIWISGLNMIVAHPFIGVGAGAFAWANDSGEFGRPQWMQSHNLYIEIFATTGIIGFSVYFLFIYFLMKRLFRLARARYPDKLKWIIPFSKSFTVIIVGLLISGMFGHNLYRYTWYMLAGLSLTLMHIINVYTNKEAEK